MVRAWGLRGSFWGALFGLRMLCMNANLSVVVSEFGL